MKKLLLFAAVCAAFALALTIPTPEAEATTTWSSESQGLISIATCTTGTESAPTLATQGLELSNISGFTVAVEATVAVDAGFETFTAGTLQAYVYNPVSGRWSRDPDLDQSVTAGISGQSYTGFQVPARSGRIAFIPNGLGVAVKITIHGTGY